MFVNTKKSFPGDKTIKLPKPFQIPINHYCQQTLHRIFMIKLCMSVGYCNRSFKERN